MPKKKDPPLSAAEQRKRFEELAREVGAPKSDDARDIKKALRRIDLKPARPRKGR